MSKRGGLGKGLGAIFGENPSPVPEPVKEEQGNIKPTELEIGTIKANPYQPRRAFDEEKLQELAASIKEFGVVQPLVVRQKGKGYELVAGERRLRAASLAGLTSVPAIIKEYDDVKQHCDTAEHQRSPDDETDLFLVVAPYPVIVGRPDPEYISARRKLAVGDSVRIGSVVPFLFETVHHISVHIPDRVHETVGVEMYLQILVRGLHTHGLGRGNAAGKVVIAIFGISGPDAGYPDLRYYLIGDEL